MPRKYTRKTPAQLPTDPITQALLPTINAAVDARIAELMRQWLQAHAPQEMQQPAVSSDKVEPTTSPAKNNGTSKKTAAVEG